MMKKQIKRVFGAFLGLAVLLSLGIQAIPATAEDSDSQFIPIVEQPPEGFSHTEQTGLVPQDLQPYDGTTAGVVSFMQSCLTTGHSMPDDIKQLYTGAEIGTPRFVKNLTTPIYANQEIHDYYIVPLYQGGNMTALAVVLIYGNGLAFGEININRTGQEISNPVLETSNSINATGRLTSSISGKLSLGKRRVTTQRLVYKMDSKGTYSRGLLSPMIELTISDGSKSYYTSNGKVADQNTFNSLEKTPNS